MKKIISVLLLCAIFCTLCACCGANRRESRKHACTFTDAHTHTHNEKNDLYQRIRHSHHKMRTQRVQQLYRIFGRHKLLYETFQKVP